MTETTATSGGVRDEAPDWDRLVSRANVPALLMVVHRLTGDDRWLELPYRPTRTVGMEEHDDGGLPVPVQDEIRSAAARALAEWARGTGPAVGPPGPHDVHRMMGVCMGEEVTEEYGEMLASQWPLVVRDNVRASPPPAPVTGLHSRVLLVGAGVSALTLSRELVRRGVEHVLLERTHDVGGAWRDNTYPGCGVDTPSHIYSHTYVPYDWTMYFAKRDEVLGYMRDFAEHQGVLPHVRLGHEVLSLDWDEERLVWRVHIRLPSGEEEVRTADVVVGATGQLNVPKIPQLPGAESFRGELFHSSHWPDGLDVTGKLVAVVGSGASAMQIVPHIVGDVTALHVLQRSPQWVAYNPHYFAEIPESTRQLLLASPEYRFWFRARQSWVHNDKVHPSLVKDPEWTAGHDRSINAANDGHRRLYERYLRERLEGREDLVRKTLPDYPPFGKRMLLDNGWFDALREPHVELIDEAAAGFTPTSVVTSDGQEREVDVVVLATGFQSLRILQPVRVRGVGGVDLHERWGQDDARAFLGTNVAGFPNLFLLCGPNTNLGHGGSWIQVAEFQADYVVRAIERLQERGARAMDVLPEREDQYVAEVDRRHDRMIWTHPGMRNWYRNAAGRVVTNTPWRIVDCWAMTRDVDVDAYRWTS